MPEDRTKLCRGCGATLTVLNRSLDMSGYCGKCAAKSQDEDDLGNLPPDVDIAVIANTKLRDDAIRLTLIAILASASCFLGAVVGAMISSPGPFGSDRVANSLKCSWLFCLVGLFVGKLLFLRKGNALTFARWKMFWGWFIIFYFLTYIPLAVFLLRLENFPLPADVVTFMLACLVAYVFGMLFVAIKDRTLKKWLCDRCIISSQIVEVALRGEWGESRRMIDETAAQGQGLISADDMMARLYLAVGLEQRKIGNNDAAFVDLTRGWETPGASDAVRFKIASAMNEAGRYSVACDMLSELASDGKDKGLVARARKTVRHIRKAHRLNLRCPKCGCRLSGTKDMVGDQATCTKCRTEFAISEDTVVR